MKKYLAIIVVSDYEGSGETLVSSREVSTKDEKRVLSIMMKNYKITDACLIDNLLILENGEKSPDIIIMRRP